ncbi:CRISPR-associated protein Csx20 [Desulfobulbus oligotrophicus]|uniref:Uncharacterized protein n=1 Tax=Desulfobulbus oligotrophicus TaxID=1909699 RepID=A0A7T5VF20_9BACT|nr:CRISPR-associated protein Csx20 [Desulfobulbus oligotrophicus]QQG66587.1 hypothetical protein HP555_12260 [Desulfobulbus oligotrophicus]
MHQLFLIFNHSFTPDQETSARTELGVAAIVEMPPELQELWANVPPELPGLDTWLQPFYQWITKHCQPGDYILIQGDFGASYLLVGFATGRQLIPVYATTRRQAREEHLNNGRIRMEHTFKHVRFRRYGQ